MASRTPTTTERAITLRVRLWLNVGVNGRVSRRTLLGVGLSAPTIMGLEACGIKPEANFNAAPFVQYVVQGAASALGTRVGVSATQTLTDAMKAARDRLRASVGDDLRAVWAADLDGKGGDIVVGGYAGDNDRLRASVLRTSSGRMLPAVVQLGLNLHADHIRQLRLKTNWSDWRGLSDGAIREWLRDELTLSAYNRKDESTDDILTKSATYLCLLEGKRDTNNNPNILIEWQPTTLEAEQSSVVIRRGRALAGHEQWESDYDQMEGLRFPVLWLRIETAPPSP